MSGSKIDVDNARSLLNMSGSRVWGVISCSVMSVWESAVAIVEIFVFAVICSSVIYVALVIAVQRDGRNVDDESEPDLLEKVYHSCI